MIIHTPSIIHRKMQEFFQEEFGKAYIGDWVVKKLHICPSCGKVGGWIGGEGYPPNTLTHKLCGHVVSWDNWLHKLKTKNRWMWNGPLKDEELNDEGFSLS